MLKNRGIVRVGAQPQAGPKTIVIVGVARGGTSIFSGALHKLGVFMGERSAPPVFEDLVLSSALESWDLSEARRVVDRYNERHAVWGFKRPGATAYLRRLHELLREPIYLFVFRDIAALARRNMLSMKAEAIPTMRQALSGYTTILDFIESFRPSGLLISCEKALIHPSDVLEQVEQYLGLEAPADRRKAALDFVEADPPQYLEHTRLMFAGELERATADACSGWAWIKNRPGPAVLTVLINGVPVGTTQAKQHRPDVQEKGIHPTGECGFHFRYPRGVMVKVGDEVAVRFQIGGDELEQSPRQIGGV